MGDGIQISCAERDRIAYVQPDNTLEIGGGQIVECCSKEQQANARLIAAAPELYEALQELLVLLGPDRPKDMQEAKLIVAATERAEAALAKAEGNG